MVSWAIKLNNTGKCLVLNKPNVHFFDKMELKFNGELDTFIKLLDSFAYKESTIIPRDDLCRNSIPWYIWIHNDFQNFYQQNKDRFKPFRVVRIICPPESEYWTLILELKGLREILTGENGSNRLLRFGDKVN